MNIPSRPVEQVIAEAREFLGDRLSTNQAVREQHSRGEDTIDVRALALHMIEEYARHNGHADLLREAVDGSTGD